MNIGKPMTDTVNNGVFVNLIKGTNITEELLSDIQIETRQFWTTMWDVITWDI